MISKINKNYIRKIIKEELSRIKESDDRYVDYGAPSGDGKTAVQYRGMYPPGSPPPAKPKEDPLKFSFQGTALHQFFDSEYMMTPLIEIPMGETRNAFRKILDEYRTAVREGESEGFINAITKRFFKHLDDMGELLKIHPERHSSPQQIDEMIKKLKDFLISIREKGEL